MLDKQQELRLPRLIRAERKQWLEKTSAVAIAQLAARRSHNPKVVSSILTRHIWQSDESVA